MVLNRTHSSTEGLREGSLSSCTGRLCQAGGNSVNRDRSLCVLLLGCLCLESIRGLASQRALDKLLTGYVTRSTYWQTSSKELHRSWLLTNTLHDPVADIWRQPHRTQSIPKELTIYWMSKIRLVKKKNREEFWAILVSLHHRVTFPLPSFSFCQQSFCKNLVSFHSVICSCGAVASKSPLTTCSWDGSFDVPTPIATIWLYSMPSRRIQTPPQHLQGIRLQLGVDVLVFVQLTSLGGMAVKKGQIYQCLELLSVF